MPFGIGDNLRVEVSAATSDFTSGMERAQESLGEVRDTSLSTSQSLNALEDFIDETTQSLIGFGISAQNAQGPLRGAALASLAFQRANDALDDATEKATRSLITASVATDQFQDNALSAVPTLTALQNRIHETGDELDRLDRKADAAGRGFARLSVEAMGLSMSLMSLRAITVVSLIPSLITLATIAAPLIATFGGIAAIIGSVAGAFGLLIGTGFITHWQEIQAEMKKARKEIVAILEPLGQVFGPLIVQAIDRLPELVEAIVKSIGGVQAFREALIQMGNIAFEVIPLITEVMFDLARDAIPVLLDGLRWLRNNGGAVFRGMMDVTNDMLPLLWGLATSFADIVPELLAFGTAVSQTVIPVLGDMLELFGANLRRLNALPEPFRQVAISALILAPALTVLSGVIPSVVSGLTSLGGVIVGLNPILLGVVAVVGVFAAAWATNFANVREITSEVIGGVITWFDDLEASIGDVIGWVEQTLNENSRAFGQFERAVNGALNGVVNFLNTTVAPIFRFVFNKVLLPVVTAIATEFSKNLGPVVSEVAETINALSGYARDVGNAMTKAWQSIDQIVLPIINSVVKIVSDLAALFVNTLASNIKLILNLIQGDFNEAWQNLENILNNVLGLFGDIVDSLATALGNAIDAAVTYLKEDALSDISGAVDAFVDGVSDLLANINLTAILGNAIFAAQKYLKEDAWGDLKGGLNSFLGLVEDAIEGTLDLIGVFGNALDGLYQYLTGTGENSALSDIRGAIDSFADSVGDALVNGIQSAIADHTIKFQLPEQTLDFGRLGEVTVGGDTIKFDLGVPGVQTGGLIESSGLAMLHEGERVVPASQVTDRGEVTVNGGPNEVRVVVEGDTGVIKDVTAEMLNQQERKITRNTGTNTNPTNR